MENYLTFIPYVNEKQLLETALNSIKSMWPNTIVIDNSPHCNARLENLEVKIYRPPVPLSFAQTQNLMQEIAFSHNLKHYFYLHSDAEALEDCAEKFLEFVNSLNQPWGVVFTHYDVFCAFNCEAVKATGKWDWRMFPWYYTDCDYFRRLKLAGFPIIQSTLKVLHHNSGSNSIKHDPYLKQVNDWYMERAHVWYQYKWGGIPSKEIFDKPFNGTLSEVL